MSNTKLQTASELLQFFYLLPASEQALMVDKLTMPQSPINAYQKFTETYLGTVIEVYRSQDLEKIYGGECWRGAFIRDDGKRILEGGFYNSSKECLEATQNLITWEIEQDEILTSFEKLIQQFKLKGYTQAGILNGLADALRGTLDKSDWQTEVLEVLEKATKLAKLPGRLLP